MLSLILKDFKTSWIFQIGIALLIPFLSSMAIFAMTDDFGGVIIGVFTVITVGLCIISSFLFITVDNLSDADMIYASLPIKRSKIVLSRYITSFIQVLISLSLVILAILSSIYIFNTYDPAFEKMLSLSGITTMIISLTMILSFIFPFIFKFGSGKGFYIAIISQIILLLLLPFVEFLQNALEGIITFDITLVLKMVKEAIQWLMSYPKIVAYIILFVIVSIIILSSIGLSVRFFNRKDL